MRLVFGTLCVFLFSFSLQAQQNCNPEINPHSWACMDWTFNGNNQFPLFSIDWQGQIEGEWHTLTYATPTANEDAEFAMITRQDNPRVPVGVLNKDTQDFIGSLTIHGDQITFHNWRGHDLISFPVSVQMADANTFKFTLNENAQFQQAFVCRDFNRNEKHHLLCSWYLLRLFNDHYTYEQRAYFGFIKD
ncbi:MAG: hypothetical protein ACXWQQ_04815 [Pseudobdellovibrio sp.]